MPYDSVFAIPQGTNTFSLPTIEFNNPNTNSYVDVSCRFLTNAVPTSLSVNGTNANVIAKVQSGTTVTPQFTADLTAATWSNLDSLAQTVILDSNDFNSTPYPYTDPQTSITYSNPASVTFSNLPASSSNGFYRLKTSN